MIKKSIAFILFILLFTFCKNPNKNKGFSHHKSGYWWQLISFTNDKNEAKTGSIAWIDATFNTQKDSVFYDSKHDMRDRFFIKTDSTKTNNLLKQLVSGCEQGDSLCVLINTTTFFEQQFKNQVPFFCKNDSVVKIYLKIKALFNQNEFNQITSQIIGSETKEIESFFGSAQNKDSARDSLGFYWVEKPTPANSDKVKAGDVIVINYEGSFLNGRIIDNSPQNFQINYGTPDQLIKGLNYVISRLKKGQNSKIILPSHLAFGENGSSNGSIPPYTPMLYKISIIDIK